MKIAVDTNVFVYSFQDDDPRALMAADIVHRLADADTLLPVQVLGEVMNAVRRKIIHRLNDAMLAVGIWSAIYEVEPTLPDDIVDAMALATSHRLQYWDALILTVAARAGAKALLTEDMQDGATIAGVRLVNPFDPANRELVDALLTPLPGTA